LLPSILLILRILLAAGPHPPMIAALVTYATATNHHKVNGLIQYIFIILLFCRSKV
jgi:hypothetical protein